MGPEGGFAADEFEKLAELEFVQFVSLGKNILRAEKKGVVAKINAGPGDSLAVDDIIIEFE